MKEIVKNDDKRFMVRQWEDIKKAGSLTFSIETMKDLLQGSNAEMLTREQLIDRITGYFNSCIKVVIDEDTGEQMTTWAKNPTKTELALVIGVDKQTLCDYVSGKNSKGDSFSYDRPDVKRVVATSDFDVIRRAYTIIESFYEGELAKNKNNAGVIFWLNNACNNKWSNEQEFKFSSDNDGTNKVIPSQTPDEIARQYGYSDLEEFGDDVNGTELPPLPPN